MEARPRQGKYRIVAELGHGGMADVYLAVLRRPMGFSKVQVVKLLRADLAEQADFRTMFLEEARLAARLSHPNVVSTLDVGEDAGRFYMAMEYLEGQALDRIQRRAQKGGGVPDTLHLTVLCEVLRGLHYAHEQVDEAGIPLTIVHRDVSPHNVIVTYDGQVKIVDFGIAKAADSVLHTRTGVLKGKLTYMAPEQARSEPVDRRADLFSVGVMLWEAVTHARFWDALTEVQVLHRLATGDFREKLAAVPAIDPKLRAVLEKALAPRESRYATAAAMEADLARAVPVESSARELGAFVTGLFEKERASVRARVDVQLRAMKASDSESAVPALRLSSPSLVAPSSDSPEARESGPPPADDELEPAPASTLGPLDAATSVTVIGKPTSTQHEAPRGWRVPVLVAANVVLAIAVAWVVARDLGPTSPPPVAPGSGAASGAPSSSSVAVHVRALPPDARLFVDDLPVPNPLSSAMPADRSVHRVRAEADGHAPGADAFVLDGRPVDVELALEHLPGSAPGKPARPGGAPPSSATPATSSKQKGSLPLDKEDPWAK